MKKTLGVFLFFLILAGCGRDSDTVEKRLEDGIEVVFNRIEPYRIPDKPHPTSLEEELVIDLENEVITGLGLYQLDTFTIDSSGNIYVLNLQAEDHHIFKFKADGQFDTSFGRHGQGPAELARPVAVIFTSTDELQITDPDNMKLAYFSLEGNLLREIPLNRNIPFVHSLIPGRFIVFGRMQPALDKRFLLYPLELCDENLEPIKLLDEYLMENFRITQRIRGTQPGFGLAVGGEKIYIGNESRGYEIWVFDSEGTLARKIKKEFHPLPVSDKLKEQALAMYNEQMRAMIYFPGSLPPFRTMTADEKGTLYVVTFEEGDSPDENRIDVFNPEGAFVSRLSAAVSVNTGTPINTVVRSGRFCYIREKESGFKQLVVERIVLR